jgi:cytosine/adenosine deaminase-related metal-dependent hydrolase
MKEHPPILERAEIHRSEWVAPVSSPPVHNGAVLTYRGRVVEVGPFPSIRSSPSASGARLLDHGRAALFPALVNAHTHLELSDLKDKVPMPQPDFREWIALLFALRASSSHVLSSEGESESDRALSSCIGVDEALRLGEAELMSGGAGLCADITNGDAAFELTRRDGPERLIFLELLGFNLSSAAEAMPSNLTLRSEPVSQAIPVPHSAYSVSPAIISECKAWTRARGLPYSIHVAEHIHEIEFLSTGRGFCREVLDWVGRWDPLWSPPGKTPVEYLDGLGVLDSRTLLVHAVHMNENDWTIAARRACNVIFCPRSNRNTGSGRPRIEKALLPGLTCALATDSLASNTDLNLFSEAGFVLDEYPSIDPRRVLEMITINPARSLGRQSDYGSIEPGRKACMLAVEIGAGVKESNLAEALIQSGQEGAWKWVRPPQN